MPLIDAHNHLHDARLDECRDTFIEQLPNSKIRTCVVNGTSPSDWDQVLQLAKANPDFILPAIGLHPWHAKEASEGWKEKFQTLVTDGIPAVGEIGLDRWIEDYDMAAQEDAFLFQLELAAEHNLPVTIHCLKAWGRTLELLQNHPLPDCGFLIHSYSGSAEMVERFTELGGYFSYSGYFADPQRSQQQEIILSVPEDRLLLETDAPDMLPPDWLREADHEFNHPANIANIYRHVSEQLNLPLEKLEHRIADNFFRLFHKQYQP